MQVNSLAGEQILIDKVCSGVKFILHFSFGMLLKLPLTFFHRNRFNN